MKNEEEACERFHKPIVFEEMTPGASRSSSVVRRARKENEL